MHRREFKGVFGHFREPLKCIFYRKQLFTNLLFVMWVPFVGLGDKPGSFYITFGVLCEYPADCTISCPASTISNDAEYWNNCRPWPLTHIFCGASRDYSSDMFTRL